jgi:hypothetical protein
MSHSSEELLATLTDARTKIGVGDRYAHYKHPERTYRVVEVSLIEETLEPAVVYEAEYGEKLSFIRPLDNFLELIDVDGAQILRFSRITEQGRGTE